MVVMFDAEADLVGVGRTEQVRGGQARVVDQLVGLDAGREGHAVVGVAVEQVVVDGAQAGVRDLRAGSVVEPGHGLTVGARVVGGRGSGSGRIRCPSQPSSRV